MNDLQPAVVVDLPEIPCEMLTPVNMRPQCKLKPKCVFVCVCV